MFRLVVFYNDDVQVKNVNVTKRQILCLCLNSLTDNQ